jgi:hypothetical protein
MEVVVCVAFVYVLLWVLLIAAEGAAEACE